MPFIAVYFSYKKCVFMHSIGYCYNPLQLSLHQFIKEAEVTMTNLSNNLKNYFPP